MFPEIRTAIKRLLDRSSSEPISIAKEIKSAGGVAFDAINVGWYARNGYPGLYSILSGGLPAWAGEHVSIETAMNHSVVWACNRIISETVAMLPLVMLQTVKDAKRVAYEHPSYTLLHDAPSDEMTALGYRSTETSHCVLGGNAYSQIIRRSGTGTAIELHPLQPAQVWPDREKEGQKRLVYCVKEGNSPDKTFTVQKGKPQDILHLRGLGGDGIQGFSVITMARQSIGTAIAAERNVAGFYRNGGRLPYNLKLNQKFKTDEDAQKFRAEWEAIYSQPHRAPMLEPWLEYQQTGLNSKDSQLLETRLFDIHEICRWFLVSPHLVGDLSRATFSNIEQLALEFVKMTLSTWITRWEQELWRCLLTPEEKTQGYFFKHNLNALLRGDFLTRMQGYSTMLQNGIACIDEVRDLEDWNPAPKGAGEDYHIQLNQQTLPGGAPLSSQAASLVRLGSD
jgi:HK97 family phage portal protein